MKFVFAILVALLVITGCASTPGFDTRHNTDLSVSDRNRHEVTNKQRSNVVHASGSTVEVYGRL